jgi:hypothetical protein
MVADVKAIIEIDPDAVAGGVDWEKLHKCLARLRAWGEEAEIEIREKQMLLLASRQQTKARPAKLRLVTAKSP